MRRQKQNQNGNILFLILIAVALFAALSYAVTNSTRNGNADVSREKVKLFKGEMENTAAAIYTAFTRLGLQDECGNANDPHFIYSPWATVVALSSTNPLITTYGTDPDSFGWNYQTSAKCNVFDMAQGGGVAMSWSDNAAADKWEAQFRQNTLTLNIYPNNYVSSSPTLAYVWFELTPDVYSTPDWETFLQVCDLVNDQTADIKSIVGASSTFNGSLATTVGQKANELAVPFCYGTVAPGARDITIGFPLGVWMDNF
jgi:hypothetical protein